MAGKKNKVVQPAAWVRINPYTQRVYRQVVEVAPAAPAAKKDVSQKTVCPDCTVVLTKKHLAQHLRESCPKRLQKDVTPCSQCGRPILTAELAIHEDSNHRRRIVRAPQQRMGDVSGAPGRTGVFCDDGFVLVLYKGVVVSTTAASAREGKAILDAYHQQHNNE